MRTELAELERVHEPGRRLRRPLLDRAHGRQSVEGGVELHRVEALGVDAEPLALGQLLRIHDPAPVAVHPARAPDADLTVRAAHPTPTWRCRLLEVVHELGEGGVALALAHAEHG